jgi:hypothetical protein
MTLDLEPIVSTVQRIRRETAIDKGSAA